MESVNFFKSKLNVKKLLISAAVVASLGILNGCSSVENLAENATQNFKSSLGLDPGIQPVGSVVPIQIVNQATNVTSGEVETEVEALNLQATRDIATSDWKVTIIWSQVSSPQSGVKTVYLQDGMNAPGSLSTYEGYYLSDYSACYVSVNNNQKNGDLWQSAVGKEGLEIALQAHCTGPVAPYAYGLTYPTEGNNASPRILHDFLTRSYCQNAGSAVSFPSRVAGQTIQAYDYMGYVTALGQIATGGIND